MFIIVAVYTDVCEFIRLHDVDFVCRFWVRFLTRTKGGVFLPTFFFGVPQTLAVITLHFRFFVTFVVVGSLVVAVSLVRSFLFFQTL